MATNASTKPVWRATWRLTPVVQETPHSVSMVLMVRPVWVAPLMPIVIRQVSANVWPVPVRSAIRQIMLDVVAIPHSVVPVQVLASVWPALMATTVMSQGQGNAWVVSASFASSDQIKAAVVIHPFVITIMAS